MGVEVCGVGSGGRAQGVQTGMEPGGQDAASALLTGWVCVEQQHDMGGRQEKRGLKRRQAQATEGNRVWEAFLGQSHDRPGALDDHDSGLQMLSGAVPVVEQTGFRIARGPLPLAEAWNLSRVETASGIAERSAVEVVEADGAHTIEEAATGPDTGFEEPQGGRCQATLTEERMDWFEAEGRGEGREHSTLRGHYGW